MATDTQAMTLLIRLMPLMQREFSLRIDPSNFFADPGYRDAVLESALGASEPRLRGYAEQLRARLAEIGKGSPGALRSSANASASASAAAAAANFEQTTPGHLPGNVAPTPSPAQPADGDAAAAAAAAAKKYIGRLR